MTDQKDTIQDVVMDLFHHAGVSCNVEVVEFERLNNNNGFNVSVNSEDNLTYLSGRNGSNLGSIEHLIRVVLTKKEQFKSIVPFITLDVNGIRKERHEKIKNLAMSVAYRVTETGRPEVLHPMDAFERRIVHNELATLTNIETESIGMDPNRRIVVKPVI